MENSLYHVLNRGVDKKIIFLDDADRARFIHNLYEFNDTKPAPDFHRRSMRDIGSPTFGGLREKIVDIHGWCLMDNHYHILVSDRIENGVLHFMRKVNIGYAKYFNEKYQRTGFLFQGKTKKVLIDSDPHFLHILHYIHLNPLDFLPGAEDWRNRNIVIDACHAHEHLEAYRWSSYQDYCGKHNFPSILTKELFTGVFEDVQKATQKYLKGIEMTTIRHLTLE